MDVLNSGDKNRTLRLELHALYTANVLLPEQDLNLILTLGIIAVSKLSTLYRSSH